MFLWGTAKWTRDDMSQNSPDPSQQQPVDDDVLGLSLYGDHDIDQADHRVNRKK